MHCIVLVWFGTWFVVVCILRLGPFWFVCVLVGLVWFDYVFLFCFFALVDIP